MVKKKATQKKRTKKVVEPLEPLVEPVVESPWYDDETDMLGGFAASSAIAVFPDGSTDPVMIESVLELSGRLRDLEHRVTALEILLAVAGIAVAVTALIYFFA